MKDEIDICRSTLANKRMAFQDHPYSHRDKDSWHQQGKNELDNDKFDLPD
jgi:hypothetical protein